MLTHQITRDVLYNPRDSQTSKTFCYSLAQTGEHLKMSVHPDSMIHNDQNRSRVFEGAQRLRPFSVWTVYREEKNINILNWRDRAGLSRDQQFINYRQRFGSALDPGFVMKNLNPY